MKLKKTFTIFVFISLVVIFFSSFLKTNNDKKQKLTVTARLYKRETINDRKYLSIKVALTNGSLDTFQYIIMSCYYPFYYRIYPLNYVIVEGEDCNKNVAELVKIPPAGNIETIVRLPIKENISWTQGQNFRIGVNLITVSHINNLLNGKEILSFNHKENKTTLLKDTSYKIGINLITVSKSGEINKFNTPATVHLLWSNKIKL